MDEQPDGFGLEGEIDFSQVDLDPAVPLRIAAVRDGEIVAAERIDPAGAGEKTSYRLPVPLRFPCGFRLVLGRHDLPLRQFLAAPLVERWLSVEELRQQAGGREVVESAGETSGAQETAGETGEQPGETPAAESRSEQRGEQTGDTPPAPGSGEERGKHGTRG